MVFAVTVPLVLDGPKAVAQSPLANALSVAETVSENVVELVVSMVTAFDGGVENDEPE